MLPAFVSKGSVEVPFELRCPVRWRTNHGYIAIPPANVKQAIAVSPAPLFLAAVIRGTSLSFSFPHTTETLG